MADLNVERKSPGVWPWVLGLLVLALVIWGLVEMFGGDDEAAQTPAPMGPADTVQTSGPAPFPDTGSALPAAPLADSVPTTSP